MPPNPFEPPKEVKGVRSFRFRLVVTILVLVPLATIGALVALNAYCLAVRNP